MNKFDKPILLVNPGADLDRSLKRMSKLVSPVPPLALALLAAELKKRGFKVEGVDQFAENISNTALAKRIAESDYLLIGVSALTPNMPAIEELTRLVRAAGSKTPIVMGNTHAVIFHKELVESGVADYVILGEGEPALVELAERLARGENPAGVRGLVWKADNGKAVVEPKREPMNPEDIAMPEWEVIRLNLYTEAPMVGMNQITLPVQMSRGCDYRCVFCAQNCVHPTFKRRPVENVVDELERNIARYGVNHFGFIDSYFPPDIEAGHEFCNELERRKLSKKIVWVTETRVDTVDLELLRRMKRNGLRLVMYGFEAGNQEVLRKLGKKTTLEQARRAMAATKAAGLYTLGLFMIGNPGETRAEIRQTIDFAKELDCDFVKFNIVVPLPGSALFKKYAGKNNGKLQASQFTSWYDWSKEAEGAPAEFAISELSMKELSILQKKAMTEYYLRPKTIVKHLLFGPTSATNIMKGGAILMGEWLDSLKAQFSGAVKL